MCQLFVWLPAANSGCHSGGLGEDWSLLKFNVCFQFIGPPAAPALQPGLQSINHGQEMIIGKELELHLGDQPDLKLAESRRRRAVAAPGRRHMKAQTL